MTSAAEALGMTLPGAASIPADDSRHAIMAAQTEARCRDGLGRPQAVRPHHRAMRFITRSPLSGDRRFDQPAVPCISIALARRAGSRSISTVDAVARATPLLANIPPVRQISDGGLLLCGRAAAVLKQLALGGMLKEARTVNGATLGENVEAARTYNEDVIRPLDNPLVASTVRGAARISRPTAP